MSDLSLGITVAGVAEAVATLQRVGAAVGQTTQATAQANRANEGFGVSAQTAASRVAGMANAIQSLTSRLGSQNQTAGLIGSIAGTTAQFAGMGSAIGPQGAVLGAVVGFGAALYQLRDAHSAVAEAAAAQAQAERDLAEVQRRGSGETTHALAVQLQTQRQLIAQHQAELVEMTEGATGALMQASDAGNLLVLLGVAPSTGSRADALRARIASEQAIADQLDARLAAGGNDDTTGLAGLSSGGGPRLYGGASADQITAMTGRGQVYGTARSGSDRLGGVRDTLAAGTAADLAEAHGQFADEADARAASYEGELAAVQALTEKRLADKAALDEQIAAQRELTDAANEASKLFSTGYVNSIDQVITQWTRANTAIRAAGGQMLSSTQLLERGMVATGNRIAETVGGTMKGAFESALGAWLDGSKSFVEAAEAMAKGVLKALVTEAIVQGVVELARGIADLASYRYDSAGLHFAAAAAWAAVGAVAGGVGAAVGAFGGGGGASAGGASTRDTASAERERNGQGGGTTINNYVYPGGFITKHDVNAALVQAMNEAARQGERVDPRLVGRAA